MNADDSAHDAFDARHAAMLPSQRVAHDVASESMHELLAVFRRGDHHERAT